MSVTARFYVDQVTKRAYNPKHVSVTLRAAGRGDENKAWAQATPTGTIELTINNPDAAAFFEQRLGRDVGLVFTDLGEPRQASQHGDCPVTDE